jgi:methanogenic corrinoid protein MtbC1
MTTSPVPVFSSISDVERDVGVAKETLRVWERRYGFPSPQRDANGERIYPPGQVHKLVLIKRLIDQGYRPGKIVGMETAALAELGGKPVSGPAARSLDDPEIVACLDLLRSHKLTPLRQRLSQAMLTMGMKRCVIELIAPLTTAVGVAWAQGRLAVFEEHLYADMLETLMRSAIVAATGHRSDELRPRVILTTVPQERHNLGLLMAEALMALEGASCISLGVQTPLADIVEAVRSQQADIVALSFSGVTSPRAAVDNINELRTRLGDAAEIWAGGAGVAMARRHLQPGTVLDLLGVSGALARWREQHEAMPQQAARRA